MCFADVSSMLFFSFGASHMLRPFPALGGCVRVCGRVGGKSSEGITDFQRRRRAAATDWNPVRRRAELPNSFVRGTAAPMIASRGCLSDSRITWRAPQSDGVLIGSTRGRKWERRDVETRLAGGAWMPICSFGAVRILRPVPPRGGGGGVRGRVDGKLSAGIAEFQRRLGAATPAWNHLRRSAEFPNSLVR